MSTTLQHFPSPGSALPVSKAVGVPAAAMFYQLGAQFPEIIDPAAPPRSVQAFGDTYTQTRTTLQRLDGLLGQMGLRREDVTNARVYLVADPATGGMDVEGFNRAYAEYFAPQGGGYPSRTVFQAAGLVNPGWLVEIEVTAAR